MKHDINEVMKLWNTNTVNTYATVDYCKAHNIPMPIDRQARRLFRENKVFFATPAISHNGNSKNDTIHFLDMNGKKTAYLFGSYTWFDSQEELDEYRKEYHKKEEEQKARNKLKKAIAEKLDQMSLEDIEKIFKNL